QGTYSGQAGHTYRFFSQATDHVGHVEAPHATPDAATTVEAAGRSSTTTAVESDHTAGSVYGQAVTFTATVRNAAAGGPVPTGDVQFVIDGSPVGSPLALDATGEAAFTTSILTASGSPHTVAVDYLGTADFEASSDSLAQAVRPRPLHVSATGV